MSAAVRSSESGMFASVEGPSLRKPKLAQENPRMLEAEKTAANVLDAWMRRRNISNTELAEAWGVSESIVRGLRTRERPLRVAHILMLPASAKRALFALLEDVELTSAA